MPARAAVRRPDRKRLSGAVRGVREGRPPTDGDGASGPDPGTGPDPAVAELAAEPFASVADARERLAALEALFRERGDRRGAFLVVYVRVTEAVGRGIREGAFADPDWTADYLVTFADLYRRALWAYERGDLAALPDPWQVAFETAARADRLAAQDVVLGINAHVNYDLALALDAVGIGPDRDLRYADHCAVNRILRRLVDEVQDLLAEAYAPEVVALDESLGRLDESLGFFTLREGRESAWRSAVALNSRFALRRRLARWVLRVSSTGAAYAVRTPDLDGSPAERAPRVLTER